MEATTIPPAPPRPAPSEDALTVLAALEERSGSVGMGQIVRIALDSLLANKVRSLLTTLGVIIGVASVVSLLSLGSGVSRAITSQIESTGTNLLTVIPGEAGGPPGSSAPAQTLTYGDAQAIARLGLPIVGPAPQYSAPATLVAPAADTRATVAGVTPEYQQVEGIALARGSFISADQVRSVSAVLVLGANVAETLFGRGEALGQPVRVGDQRLRVVGVLAPVGGGGFGSLDDQVFVPITVAQQRLFGARTPTGNDFLVSSITLAVADRTALAGVQQRIEVLLRDRHNLAADGEEDDFSVIDQTAFLETFSTVISVLTLFLSAVAAISLLVGGIGIMNIMLVSVTERTREIGLRKAVGARGRDILLQFVVEALVLSLAGGLIGLAIGSVVPLTVTLLGVFEAPVTVGAVLTALGFSLTTGLIFGIWPAQRAARLDPIVALRYE